MYSPRHARFCFATHVESQVAPGSGVRHVALHWQGDMMRCFKSDWHFSIFTLRYVFIVRKCAVLTLLIVGLGDVAKRALPDLRDRYAITALSRSLNTVDGVQSLCIDLDEWALSEAQAAVLAQSFDAVWYTAPPSALDQAETPDDRRLRRLLAFWQAQGVAPKRVVYVSTTGVYGDCAGEWVDETRTPNPQSLRAQRRLAAEQAWRDFAYATGSQVVVLRAPGIYALERLPYASVLANAPVLMPAEDAFSNHIHADDLAQIAVFFLERQAVTNACLPFDVFNACDDEPLRMGDWMSAVAQVLGLPTPTAISRTQMQAQVSPARWSFMRESRRLSNAKLKNQGVSLRHPSALAFVRAHAEAIRAYAAQQQGAGHGA